MHVCKDEAFAAGFVKNAQRLNSEIKKEEAPISEQQEDELKEEIYRAMLYKTGGVDTGFCGMCKKDFKQMGPVGSVGFQKTLFWSAFFMMLCQVAASVFMSVLDAGWYATLPTEGNGTEAASDFERHLVTTDVPLASVQMILTLIIIYLLIVLSRLTTSMVDKDDPFSNVYLIALIILFVDTQRIVFKVLDLIFMAERSQSADPNLLEPRELFDEMIITRYATMSMEMLFIIIPIRHNFLLHQVEI